MDESLSFRPDNPVTRAEAAALAARQADERLLQAYRLNINIQPGGVGPQALAVAAENFRRLGVGVDLRRADALADLAEVFPGPFDVVVSNPPYVPASDRMSMHVNVRDY